MDDGAHRQTQGVDERVDLAPLHLLSGVVTHCVVPVRRGKIDESYVGGPEPGKPGRAAEDKAIVAAAVEKRGKSCGRVRLGVIANVSADVLTAFVGNHLGDGGARAGGGLRVRDFSLSVTGGHPRPEYPWDCFE